MTQKLCKLCSRLGYCRKRYSQVFTDAETRYGPLNWCVLNHCYSLTRIHNLKPLRCREFTTDLYRDLPVVLTDSMGNPVELDMSVFEASDEDTNQDEEYVTEEEIRRWFERIFCTPPPQRGMPAIRDKHRKRFRILASIICAAYPEQAIYWPRLITANDNFRRT